LEVDDRRIRNGPLIDAAADDFRDFLGVEFLPVVAGQDPT